uniref:Uncharacterized protein n=1 Tax=Arundo donax TaxID=35708 RepID=A0A0A9C841_ARUDO
MPRRRLCRAAPRRRRRRSRVITRPRGAVAGPCRHRTRTSRRRARPPRACTLPYSPPPETITRR